MHASIYGDRQVAGGTRAPSRYRLIFLRLKSVPQDMKDKHLDAEAQRAILSVLKMSKLIIVILIRVDK